MPKLVIVAGPNRGAVIHLLPDRNRIGRDADAEVPLVDALASRAHAEIDLCEGGFGLCDGGSRNGTYLNGLPCEARRRYPLRDGDEVRAGATALLYVDRAEAEPLAGSTTALAAAGPGALLVGRSPAILRVAEAVKRAAGAGVTVLVRGESGTGKELVAAAVHRAGPRAGAPFLALNAASLAPELLESELFGHERGAFTGAVARKPGLLELAAGGTLFLDEIAELPASSQAKLLRALESREFRRVGGTETLRSDVRIVAATHADLEERVREGAFREDLFFRLRVLEIDVPPLRERREDIPLLVEHFLGELGARIPTRTREVSERTLECLRRYRFPGNVRELRNLLERALIFASGARVEPEDLPAEVRAAAEDAGLAAPLALETVERAHIRRVLREAGGNKTRAAALLGIDRATLYRKLERDERDGPGRDGEPA